MLYALSFMRRFLTPQEITIQPLIARYLAALSPEFNAGPPGTLSRLERKYQDTATPVEVEDPGQRVEHAATSHRALATYLAGRWAAKEAIIKAHTRRNLKMRDIWIISARREDGASVAPRAIVLAELSHNLEKLSSREEIAFFEGIWSKLEASKRRFGPLSNHAQSILEVTTETRHRWQNGHEVKVSISHDTDYATAVCLAPDGS